MSDSDNALGQTTSVIGQLVADAMPMLKTKMNEQKFILHNSKIFKDYLENLHSRVVKIKTLLNRAEPVAIKDAYVNQCFQQGNRILDEDEIILKILSGDKFVVRGIAGSGKSMFMKKLALDLINDKNTKYLPIFFELRHVKFSENENIKTILTDHILKNSSEFDEEIVRIGLEKGYFLILVDGFDEVDDSLKPFAEEAIVNCSINYASCPIVLTSRQDRRFLDWEYFNVSDIIPFNRAQVRELVDKIQYNNEDKRRFLKHLEKDLFDTHADLLSNPLLCSMMLLTHSEFAEVPSKMHLFYKTAFEVLYQKHDSIKTDFARKYRSGLSFDDFQRVFSTFCFLSRLNQRYTFYYKEIIKLFEEAIEFERYTEQDRFKYTKPEYILRDIKENVCIILQDGDQYSFLHRSFQEYFCALMLSSGTLGTTAKDYIEYFSRDSFDSQVFEFLREISPHIVREEYLLPRGREIVEELDQVFDDEGPKGVFLRLFSTLEFLPEIDGNVRVRGWVEIDEDYIFRTSPKLTWLGFYKGLKSFRASSQALSLPNKQLDDLIAVAPKSDGVQIVKQPDLDGGDEYIETLRVPCEALTIKFMQKGRLRALSRRLIKEIRDGVIELEAAETERKMRMTSGELEKRGVLSPIWRNDA